MASSGTQKSFDHFSFDYVKVGPRRAHMKAFFLHLGLWNEEKVKIIRDYSQEQACEIVNAAGYDQINQAYFELMVDQIVWYNLLQNGNAIGQGHDWPWTIEGAIEKTDLTTYGASGFYNTWKLRKQEAVERLKSKAGAKDQTTLEASSSQDVFAAETAASSSAATKVSETAPVQLGPEPEAGGQAAFVSFGQPAQRPLGKQGYGISSSMWATKPRVDKPPVEKPPVDNSADIARVADAFADISLGVAAGESAKKEKGKEKATAEATASKLKAERLEEKLGYAYALYDDEVVETETQRAHLDRKKILDATAEAVQNGYSPDDWHHFAEEDDDTELVIPANVELPVRHDFGANNDVNCEGPMGPVPEYLQDIWEELRLGKCIHGPIIRPFEIALPEWIDFHDLVYGDDGVLYAMIEDEALIDRDIVITWSTKNGRPVSLVVGPKPSLKCDYEDKQLWLRVRATWLKVAEWLANAYYGRPHRLTDFLRYRQEQELMGVPQLQIDQVLALLMNRWGKISQDPDADVDALSWREELDVWTPQLHAIFSQSWGHASKIAQTWVLREGVKPAYRRLEVAEYVLAAFRPEDAYRWGRDVYAMIETYDNEIPPA
ncbi:Uncharacterized protein LW93_5130 [Fusarium fujikuroi]|nr:Uncharacterized protein LW93_5130 [Fusarium fujikuroi]